MSTSALQPAKSPVPSDILSLPSFFMSAVDLRGWLELLHCNNVCDLFWHSQTVYRDASCDGQSWVFFSQSLKISVLLPCPVPKVSKIPFVDVRIHTVTWELVSCPWIQSRREEPVIGGLADYQVWGQEPPYNIDGDSLWGKHRSKVQTHRAVES